jgi:hypothetical protein
MRSAVHKSGPPLRIREILPPHERPHQIKAVWSLDCTRNAATSAEYVPSGSTHKSRLACLSCHNNQKPFRHGFPELKSVAGDRFAPNISLHALFHLPRGTSIRRPGRSRDSATPAFHSRTLRSLCLHRTEITIPDLNTAPRFRDEFPCAPHIPTLQSPRRFSFSFTESTCMVRRPPPLPTQLLSSSPIPIACSRSC